MLSSFTTNGIIWSWMCISNRSCKIWFLYFLTNPAREPNTKLVTKEMLIFKCYQVDSKEIKCPLQWWAKHEAMFLIGGFLAHWILGIIGPQIEIEIFFSLARIFTNLNRSLQSIFKKEIDIFGQKLTKLS
jgi:hypothetical protein